MNGLSPHINEIQLKTEEWANQFSSLDHGWKERVSPSLHDHVCRVPDH